MTAVPTAPTAARPLPYAVLLAALVLVLAAYRLAVRDLLGLGLHFDEAQYFVWSLDPAWGYFSKPPMVAWTIGAARLACGDGTFCIRLPSVLAFSLATALVYLTGRRLFDDRTAFWAAVLFVLAPLVAFLSWFITTDALLLLAWAAALYAFVRALQADGTPAALPWWLATGAAAGLGLLSKYTMGIFAVSALGFLVATPALHRQLRAPGPWLGALLAALIFAPNLVWNAQHGFATFGHTAHIASLDAAQPSPRRALEFLVAQVGIFGPVTMAAFALAAVARSSAVPSASAASAPWAMGLLRWFALPFLALITLQALAARAHANWAAPAYVAAALLAARWIAQRPGTRWLTAAVLVDVLIMVAAGAAVPLLGALDVRVARDPTAQLMGWEALGRAVRRSLEDAPPGTRLLVDDRRLMSLVIYYGGPHARDALTWNPEGRITNHYQLLRDVSQSPDGPFLLISERDRGAELAAAFESVRPLGLLGAPPGADADPRARRVHAWLLGRLRTPPAHPNDPGHAITRKPIR